LHTCVFHPLDSLKNYRFVVVFAFHQGKLILSRHKDRQTWETQGGHVEPGETPLDAAKRELWEESGAAEFTIRPLYDYWASDVLGSANGQTFVADVTRFDPLPDSEMAEIRAFDALPENLTYPYLTPGLYEEALRLTARQHTPEIWDGYLADGSLAGVDLVRGEPIPEGLYHLVCDILVRHTDGDYLLMQRSRLKPNYAGWYEATAGGSALKGEDALTCARRELQEETGIRADSLTELGSCVVKDTIYRQYLCLTSCHKEAVTLQPGETVAYRWLTPEALREAIDSGEILSTAMTRWWRTTLP
jgi:8-oxo-dGTP pyrophosphatase MutT (NUDIX family)